ncbi:MAG: 4-hydroxy-3-methylbut-2-enyl diphosphate reductase [Prosthecobacter sp.]
MNIIIAQHYGMCFGVRDALRATHDAAKRQPVTILGQLVHNSLVDRHLSAVGARKGDLNDLSSATTQRVIITAHDTSDAHRQRWLQSGHEITDTTCPLVHKAHQALVMLVGEGYQPVVIGQHTHVEVRGLVGDHPQAVVVLSEADLDQITPHPRLGVVSQTTQPVEVALRLVASIKQRFPVSEVRFIDTICHPTKQRQTALEDLCRNCDHLVVIGGRNSNNTRQLAEKAAALGVQVLQIESDAELEPAWFTAAQNVGVTAGTSTLDETVHAVVERLRTF